MTLSVLSGFLHVRRAPHTVGLVLGIVLLVWVFPYIDFGVSLNPFLPSRPVGTLHLAYVILICCLPVFSLPAFGGRELLAGITPRLAHVLYSMILLVVPAVVVPFWLYRVGQDHAAEELPTLLGLLGLPLALSAVSVISCMVLGRLWSVVMTLAAFSSLVVWQQTHPKSLISRWFETRDHLYTNWWIPVVLIVLALWSQWHFRSLPWGDRRQ